MDFNDYQTLLILLTQLAVSNAYLPRMFYLSNNL